MAGIGELALLDTGVIVHFARQDATGRAIEERYSFTTRAERPLLSSIVKGEALAIARWRAWEGAKARLLEELLANLVLVEAGVPEVIEAYADLYCEARRRGRLSETKQNDLWIAATAIATGAAIYTCDADFDWLSPGHITVHYIPETR